MCCPLTMRTPLIAYATLDDDFDAGLDAGGSDGEVGDGLCVPDDALDTVLPYVSALGKSCLKCLGFDVGARLGPTGGDGGFSGDGGGGPGCLDGSASEPSSESATVTVPAGGDREFDVGNLLTNATEAVTVMPAGGGGGGMVCSTLLTLPGEGGVGPENAGMRPLTVPTVPSLPVESGVGQRSDGTRPMAVPAVPQSAVSTTTTATSSPSSLSSWSVENTPSVLAAKPKAVLTRLRRRRRTGHRNRKRCWSLKLPPRLLPAADLDSGDDSGNGNDNDSEYNYSTGGNGNGHCHGFAARHLSRQGRRQCSHCNTAETPQWRVGPAGPGTLCNACGIRFKMNRLLPEYRPSTSPSFVSSHHSNRHKNVLKIREGKVFKDTTTSLHCS